jgi:hypothetical protein
MKQDSSRLKMQKEQIEQSPQHSDSEEDEDLLKMSQFSVDG